MITMLCVHETPARLFKLFNRGIAFSFFWLIKSEIYFAYLFLMYVAYEFILGFIFSFKKAQVHDVMCESCSFAIIFTHLGLKVLVFCENRLP